MSRSTCCRRSPSSSARKLPDHKIDGLDIWPLLAGEKDARNPHEVYFFYGVPFGVWSGAELESVRTREWKLILPHAYRTLGGHKPGMDGWPGEYVKQPFPEPELYDMRDDIEEKHNVAAEHPEIVQRMLEHGRAMPRRPRRHDPQSQRLRRARAGRD